MAESGKRIRKLSELTPRNEVEAVRGDLEIPIEGIAYHSAQAGPGYLFVAIAGAASDGHRYIENAVQNGAAAVLHERETADYGSVTMIRSPDTRLAMARAAARFYDHPSRALTMVGVTGTNGKTTTTYILESIFKEAGYRVGVIGTINYRYADKTLKAPTTTPQSLDLQRLLREMADAGVTHVVMEVSSHALEQKRVDEIDFDAVVFTNLSQDHLDYHLDMESYFQAKAGLFDPARFSGSGARISLVNFDDSYGHRVARECGTRCVSFGLAEGSEVTASSIRTSVSGLDFTIRAGALELRAVSRLVGRVNAYNILAAAGVALELGIEPAVVERGIAALEGAPGRLFAISGPDGVTAYVDYAHTPDALRKALESIRELSRGRVITVFGCGGNRDRGKRPLMGRVVGELSDVAIVTSDNPRSEDPEDIIRQIEPGLIEAGMLKSDPDSPSASGLYVVESERSKAITLAARLARPQDVILIAGKGHEDYQIVGNTVRDFDDTLEIKKAFKALS